MIREFEPRDKEAYLSMSKEFYSGDAALFPVQTENFERTFSACMERSPYVRGYALEAADGTMGGYALLALYWSCEAGGMVVQLEEFYLSPSLRGQGMGTAFLHWLEDTYGETTARFRLEVCPQNPRAKQLYERHGYQELPYIQMVKNKNV